MLADDPALTVRLGQVDRQPLRVIVDTRLRTPPQAKILGQAGRTLIMTAVNDAQLAGHDPDRVCFVTCHATRDGVDLDAVMKHLASLQVNELHVECGATLAGSLLRGGHVDEIVLYLAATIMGDQARGLFHLPELEHMPDRIRLQYHDIRMLGDDLRIIASPQQV